MKEFWKNTYHTLVQQKWRSLMTAFGVFWGIFILVIIMGIGNGLTQGSMGKMLELPFLVELYAMPTSIEYKGFPIARKWTFDDRGTQLLEEKFNKQIKSVTKICLQGEQVVSLGTRSGIYDVLGISPEFVIAYPQRPIAGRNINHLDIERNRKVCVIGEEVADFYEAKVGDELTVNGGVYTIVGITRCTNKLYAEEKNPSVKIFLPVTTAQIAFGRGTRFDAMYIFMNDGFSSVEYQREFENFLRGYYGVHPDDIEAVRYFNTEEFIVDRNVTTVGMDILLWLVGIGTLIGGLIGISNIMLVSIKERTLELGVYRALGAQPYVIIRMILAESLMLTLSAGLAGLAAGLYSLGAVRAVLSMGDSSDSMISNPYMPVNLAIISVLILVAGGLVSGYIPIRNALKCKVVDALRAE